MLLVQFEDGIDFVVNGFRVYENEQEFRQALIDYCSKEYEHTFIDYDELLNYDQDFSIYFDAGELSYSNPSMFINQFNIVPINDNQAKVIKEIFDNTYGFFPLN